MVWGGRCLEGHTDLYVIASSTLTAARYLDEILRTTVSAVGPMFLLMQDNAWPHVARVYRHLLND